MAIPPNGVDCVDMDSGIYTHAQASQPPAQSTLAELELYWREELRFRPNEIEVLNELGLAIWRQGRPAEAEPIYRRARQIDPTDYRVISNLGLAVYDQDRIEEAADFYRLAIEIQPNAFDALMNLGLVFSDLGRFDEAQTYIDAAHRVRPNSADLWHIEGLNLGRQGRWHEAIEKYEHALQLQYDYPRLHMNLAYAFLCLGDFERGWREHEWRLRWRDFAGCRVNRPLWTGDYFPGRTILLHGEQGLGDTLQFIRFAPQVKARGGIVLVCCPARLLRVVARCEGVDLAFEPSTFEPDCHIHAPLMSLPAILGTSLATLPRRVPYLATDPVLVDHWRSELDRLIATDSDNHGRASSPDGESLRERPLRIGIAWQGQPTHRMDRWRSFPLGQFTELGKLPGVRLISLQTDHGLDQLSANAGRLPVIELSGRRTFDLAETAAIMANLDLVITPDTAAAHLAGGLGVPVWVGLNAMGDWRWLVGREDSPWYPTMTLFHQTTLGDWDGVFERMAQVLEREMAKPIRSQRKDLRDAHRHGDLVYRTVGAPANT